MSHSIIISYNSASLNERTFVKDLLDYLGTKNINAIANDPNVSESEMKRWLPSAKWLVLILTPESLSSPQVQSLVNTAFGHIKQGHIQGVLALASSSNPVELEDLPPLWSTMRIYYAGERIEDHQQAFEKLSRTLDDTRSTVPVATSSTNNWASSFSSAASRPQPMMPQTTRRTQSRLVISIVAALVLIIFFLAFFLGTSLILKFRTPPTPTPDVKAIIAANQTAAAIAKARTSAIAHANASVTAQANATASATAQTNATASAISNAQAIYKKNVDLNKPHISMDTKDQKQQWDQTTSCTFVNGSYQISNGIPGQYTRCMAHLIKPKNFAYQVQMTISSSGDAGGLIFRADNSLMTLYRLSLDGQGTYILFLCQSCVDTSTSGGTIVKQDSVDSINGVAQPNTLTVIVLNTAIYLYVNSKFVMQLDGSAITNSGEIGLYAVSQNQSTNVSFSDVKVWDLDSGQP